MTGSHLPKKILVGTDFSEGSDRALDAAIDFAKLVDGSLELIYVDQLPSQELPVVFGYFDLEEGGYYPFVERSLAAREARARAAGVACAAMQVEGSPAAEIVRHAREAGVDLVVVGTHGRRGISHALLGSVAERVVQRAGCPVLTVPFGEHTA
jgi:nucleotide-binding universal stress UspA family protein